MFGEAMSIKTQTPVVSSLVRGRQVLPGDKDTQLDLANARADGVYGFAPPALTDDNNSFEGPAAAGNISAASSPFDVSVNAQEVDTQALAALAIVSSMAAAPSLAVDGTPDQLINSTEFDRRGLHGFRANGRRDRGSDVH